MRQEDLAWDSALVSHLERKHHGQLRAWLIDHLIRCLPKERFSSWLMSVAEDTCDAGHVHHDIALWIIGEYELHTVMITEEHYDLGVSNVETTFDTAVASHPFAKINGMQLMSVARPDGHQMDVGLGVMISNPSMAGHVEPMSFGDMDAPTMAVNLIPSTMTLMGNAERIEEFVHFRDDLLSRTRQVKD